MKIGNGNVNLVDNPVFFGEIDMSDVVYLANYQNHINL
jgi:hypothetical protein